MDEVPPPGRLALYGLQHLLTYYATIVVLPALIAAGIGLPARETGLLLSAALFAGGVGTLVQTIGLWRIGIRLPVVLGGSAVVLGPTFTIGLAHGGGAGGLPAVFGATMAAGVVLTLVAPLYGRLMRFFPPAVTGAVIMMVGIAILPVAASLAGGGDPAAEDFGGPADLAIAGTTVAVIVVLYRFSTGLLKNIAILLGLVAGGALGALTGRADFSGVADAGWFQFVGPFHFGAPEFDPAAILAMTIATLIGVVESVANYFVIGGTVDRTPDRRELTRGVRAEGVATVLGGAFNSIPPTTFTGNIGLVRASGVRSRWVCAAAAVFMALMACLPKLAALAAALPKPAVGGALLVLFGIITAIGVQTLGRAELHRDGNLITVAVSIGLGMIPVAYPAFFRDYPEQLQVVLQSGIIISAVSAILLNIAFHGVRAPAAEVPAATGAD
ncbi:MULTISPECIES: nucleobase:cation symporter-2 family protein [Actinomadura]|uniref:Nucleobase:cation symporter-2 family protein n=1 Tax=Actinomadura yumaensis TaxID=111807 RepID=A0ABW2CDW6_9ACTN|nr:nucleobase:cation symporter-2 family protein [Actinomadura sp. J1-007]MWK35601.1 purine permease [Actinomadura sp. J1-007]